MGTTQCDTACYFKPILKTAPYKIAIGSLFMFHFASHLISDVLLWTPTYGHTSVGQPTKTYIHQFCADIIECHLEDLPCVMANRDLCCWHSLMILWF